MRILLVDHGCCDHPRTRIHGLRQTLEAAGCTVAICGPSTVNAFEEQPPGIHGIHLHDVAAASREFLAAVREGSPEAFLRAAAHVPSRVLGLARETARQMVAEAADAIFPDAIFVLHAGILADLAVETGAPVVVHVSAADLEAAAARPSLKRLVVAALGSSDRVIAADDAVAATLADWLGDDAETRSSHEIWPFDEAAAPRVAEACRLALARRRGEA
jgi:cell division septum initiation protein DivIVA